MVYKKNGRPGYKACGKMAYGDAKKALVLARHLKGLLNVEYKFNDVQLTSVGVTTTHNIMQCSNIDQGLTDITRNGNSIKAVSFEYRMVIKQNETATQSQLRIIVIKDKQTNGVIYAANDLLADVSSFDAIVAPFDPNNKYRFTVLSDRVVSLQDSGKKTAYIKWRTSLNDKIRYDASANDITDLTSSSFSIFIISNEVTNSPVVTAFARLRYVDN